jgi:hypothetical protein
MKNLTFVILATLALTALSRGLFDKDSYCAKNCQLNPDENNEYCVVKDSINDVCE